MADSTYTFVVETSYTNPGTISNTMPQTIPSGSDPTGEPDFFDGAVTKVGKSIVQQAVLSPLNQVTGGMAAPAYSLGKAVFSKAGGAAVGGAVAMIAIKAIEVAVNHIEKRMTRLENQATEANNLDNQLVKAGRKNFSTKYSADFFNGVTSNRKF